MKILERAGSGVCGSCHREVVPSCVRAVVLSSPRAVVTSCVREVVPSPFHGAGCAINLLHQKVPYLNMLNSFIGVSRKCIHRNYFFCIIISYLK